MRIPARQREYGLRLNITPLIDVVFLLIIFFLVASHFVRSENLEAVELPEATQSEDQRDEQRLRRLVVTVTADSKLHVADKTMDFAEVNTMILNGWAEYGDDFEIHVRSDKTVPYHIIEPIMIACAKAGVTKFMYKVIVK